jgi:hypothetical protein
LNHPRGGRTSELVERRFDTVLTVAGQHRTSVPIDHLAELMPHGGPSGRGEVTEWLAAHPSVGRLVGDQVAPHRVPVETDTAERRERGVRFLDAARSVVQGPLAPISGLVQCIAVTGSTAYGEPSPHDDLDFLVVTRRGSVWPFLLYTYLAARLRTVPSGPDGPSHWCFNYIMDDRVARREFGVPRGFLFAREALTARPVAGEPYYRSLVGSATWLADEVPRLYRRWASGGLPHLAPEESAPWLVRLLNAVLFPVMAWYLSLAAVARNHRLSRIGRPEKRFRVVAGIDRLAYETRRFDELRSFYMQATVVARSEAR